MPTVTDTHLDELRLRLAGGVYQPGDPEYQDTTSLFNSMIEKRPRLVARCAAPDDVVAALAFAREREMAIAVRAGGHSVTGVSLVDDGLVIDVRGMNDIEIDPQRRIARVGAGATWAELDHATQVHGLATTGGRVSTTGVAGLTMGGGSGWLERKHGLACDNLLAAELVTAEGELVRAAADENPDLLWALRGGGGNFGVVTSLVFQLHPVGPEVLAGLVVHPAERGRDLLALFRDVMLAAPEELGLAFLYFTVPEGEEGLPEELYGKPAVAVAGMYSGPVDEGEDALREIRAFGPPAADLFEPVPYADFQCSLDDEPGFRNYWTADNLVEMPDDAVEAIAARSEELAGPSQLLIAPWGGAIPGVGPDQSPVAGRETRFVVHPFILWEDAADDRRMMELGRSYREVLAPWATGTTYLNFVGDEGREGVRSGFGDRNYERLARIKQAWDPGNVFHGNQNIQPRSEAA